MKRLCISAIFSAFVALLTPLTALSRQTAQAPSSPADADRSSNKVVLILPFHNDSKAPGLEWIGEAFPEVMGQQMQSPSLFVISREDRLYAFDRVGIPASAQLSRATLLQIAEQMDVDYVVFGNYNYDGSNFTSRAQLLDMRRLHLLPVVVESGPVLKLIEIQSATGWDLMHTIQPAFASTKQDFIVETKDIHLDALENYVRGVLATSNDEKIHRFNEAVRLNPNYSVAVLQLARTYFDKRDYASAITWCSKIPATDKHAAEANFFLGLAAYYSGDMDRAAHAFQFVADRLPLSEVYNNLGVVDSRRGKNSSVEYLERAVQADPTDEDYHFNLAVSLAHSHDNAGANRQLKEALDLHPSDAEAKAYLDAISGSQNTSARPPVERIKRNYDEASYRQLAFAVESAQEAQMAHADPKKHAAMHVDLGKEQLRQGFYEEARNNFRKALALDPANTEAHVGLATAQIALNDLAGARSELDSTLQTRPTPDAYVALGQLDMKENKLDAASQAVTEALRLQPDNTAALQLKGELAGKLNSGPQRYP